MLGNKKIVGLCFLLIGIFISYTVGAKYIPNNKDTKLPPEKLDPNFVITDTSTYEKIYETNQLIYYFKEDRDILAIYDKRNDYLWKTGLDTASADEAERICFDKPRKERMTNGCEPREDGMNFLYAGLANSLITVEYFDSTRQVVQSSSATYDPLALEQNNFSTLHKVEGEDNHFILDATFRNLFISEEPMFKIKVHLLLNEKGVNYIIRDEEITGKDADRIAGILITPFLGASGGNVLRYDPEEDDFTIPDSKYRVPGYILVPDGSGALIRFTDFEESDKALTNYKGSVYGIDHSRISLNYRTQFRYVPLKEPRMPVFGIAHGDREAAFVSYAKQGAEHMEIIVTPDEGRSMNYHFGYPRFVLNNIYYQIYNRAGWNFETIHDDRSHFDININYDFLAGDGSTDGLPADYIGMAKAYRNYLLSENLLTIMDYVNETTPIRIDFIMADARNNIIGYEDVVVTTIKDVERILKDLNQAGINNINSGLLGYQSGGVTLGDPDDIDYNRNIGSKREFQDAIKNLKALGIDVSLSQDFSTINEEQIRLSGNTIKHVSKWYTTLHLFDAEATINTFYNARAERAVKWLDAHIEELEKINPESTTIEGITNILFSDYAKDVVTREDAIRIYQKALEKIADDYRINSSSPNQYTWKYIDRFLDAPVFNSQYIIQTDTVPFIQMVLNGTMEMYAPYSNYSFYTDSDVLRMIDYNVYPSFILSEEPAYLLMATNSANYYSTEYVEYKDLILSIYNRVDDALQNVIDSEWVDRRVVFNGVIVNEYSNGIEIVINYTDEVVNYKNQSIQPISYGIIDEE